MIPIVHLHHGWRKFWILELRYALDQRIFDDFHCSSSSWLKIGRKSSKSVKNQKNSPSTLKTGKSGKSVSVWPLQAKECWRKLAIRANPVKNSKWYCRKEAIKKNYAKNLFQWLFTDRTGQFPDFHWLSLTFPDFSLKTHFCTDSHWP